MLLTSIPVRVLLLSVVVLCVSTATTAYAQVLEPNPASTTLATVFEGNSSLIEPLPEASTSVSVFASREVKTLSLLSVGAYWVQRAVAEGVPANTVVLILLLPILATLVAFTRVVIGLPSLGMLVPIALAYTFVALGVTLGLIILTAVVIGSFIARFALKRVQIMQLPKHALSMLLLGISVFIALTISVMWHVEGVKEISIFPVLILTLLGDSIVATQLRSSIWETILITAVTLGLALIGFFMATYPAMRDMLLLYPETILFTIPANILIGRYFGLRLTERFRFWDIS